jgi:hypothetical protein
MCDNEPLNYEDALEFVKTELLTEEQQSIPFLAETILEASLRGSEYFKDKDNNFVDEKKIEVDLKKSLPYYDKIKDNKSRDKFHSELKEIEEEKEEDLNLSAITTAFKEF